MTDHKPLLDPALLGAEVVEPVSTVASGPLLEAVDIRKRYGRNEVLRGVSFGVERGDVKAVLGPSGGRQEGPAR